MSYISNNDLLNYIDNEFSSKKKYASKLANIFKELNLHETYKRVNICSDYLEFNHYDDDTYNMIYTHIAEMTANV